MKNLIIALLLALPTIVFSQYNYYENICDTQEKKQHDIELTNKFDWYQQDFVIKFCSTPNSPAYKTIGRMLKTANIYDSYLNERERQDNTKIEYREHDNGYLLKAITNNDIRVIAWGNTPLECIYNMDVLLSTGSHSMAVMQQNRIPE